ncbi:hypothetical protein EP7_004017 [Isosphaeraceae bacterium EP7]
MSTVPLIPQSFWFRMALSCPRVDGIPRPSLKGRFLDLPESCRLPSLSQLDGKDSWADIRVAWNPNGLAVSVEVTGKKKAVSADPYRIQSEGVGVWVDTRDTRDIHRGSRFCHRFQATLVGAGKDVEFVQKTIARAIADAPTSVKGSIEARSEIFKGGWRLEMFLWSTALHGFDPETNRRLGLLIQVTDQERDDLYLGIGREFPVGEDPSLWASLDLRESDGSAMQSLI